MNIHNHLQKKKRGFTVVELIVVIVVLGILVSVTVVAYSGWRNTTSQNEVKSDLKNVATAMENYINFNNAYPSTIPTNFTSSPDVTLTLTSIGDMTKDYCITGQSIVNTSVTYYYQPSVSTEPVAGTCGGSTPTPPTNPTGPTIANLEPNPGLETNTTGWQIVGSSTMARDSTYALTGGWAMKVTMPAASASTAGVSLFRISTLSVGTDLDPNTTYTVSAYVYVPSATTPSITLATQSAGIATKANLPTATTSVKDGWVRIVNAFTTGTSGYVNLYILNSSATTAGMVFWTDDAMLTSGSTAYTYADGSFASNGWSWTGATDNSISSGPAF